MDDQEWQKHRARSILATFQTGRPVFADSDGVLRYLDGKREPVEDHIGHTHTEPAPLPKATLKATWWQRLRARFK
jgi:hypothetical protein